MIVEAVGIAVHSEDEDLKKRLEDAMTEAVKKAQAAGITDNDEIRKLIITARDEVTALR